MATAPETDDTNAKRLERAKRIIRGLQERTEDRGCTEYEAMEAAEKIGALLQQFELTLDEVTARDVSDMVKRELYSADAAAGSLIVGIGRLCSLTTYRDVAATVTTYVIFGHTTDVELGVYLYEVCAEAMDHDWQKDMDRHGYTKKRRESFRTGFAARVSGRMTKMREQRDAERQAQVKASGCRDLVVLKDQIVEAEFAKTGIKLSKGTTRKVHDVAAYYRGQEAGQRVNLNNPLEDARGEMTPLR